MHVTSRQLAYGGRVAGITRWPTFADGRASGRTLTSRTACARTSSCSPMRQAACSIHPAASALSLCARATARPGGSSGHATAQSTAPTGELCHARWHAPRVSISDQDEAAAGASCCTTLSMRTNPMDQDRCASVYAPTRLARNRVRVPFQGRPSSTPGPMRPHPAAPRSHSSSSRGWRCTRSSRFQGWSGGRARFARKGSLHLAGRSRGTKVKVHSRSSRGRAIGLAAASCRSVP